MKCVYAFELSNSLVKIGVTGNLKNRAHTVKFDSQAKVLNVHHTSFCEDKVAYIVESACHKTFADRCAGGEYFAISFEEACAELDSHEPELDDLNIQAKISVALLHAHFELHRSRMALARQVGIPVSDFAAYEDMKKLPSVIEIVRIAQEFNVSADYLLGLIDKPHAIKVEERTPADKENARKLNVLRTALRDVLY